MLTIAKVSEAASRGDLALLRSLVEDQGGNVNERGRVRQLRKKMDSLMLLL